MKNLALRLSLLLTLAAFVTVSTAFTQTASDNETKPTVIKAVAPRFPALAIAARALGKTIVKVTINSNGEVIAIKLISGHPLLQADSREAAKRWLFSAADKKVAERFVDLDFIYTTTARKEDAGVFFMPPFQVEIIAYPPPVDY